VWWLLLLLPFNAVALSLGDLVVHSQPGEPLRAHIPLTLLGDEVLAEVHVTLASDEEYAQRHLPRGAMLQGLQLALLDRGVGQGRLQLFGEQPWQGEGVQLLFTIRWSKGQMERMYQLVAVTPDAAQLPSYVEVTQDATLDGIAIRLSKGSNRSYLHMMYALFLANPEAFYRGNMNNLKGGATLRVPTREELYRLSDREVFDGIRQQYAQWQQQREGGEAPVGGTVDGAGGSEAGAALAGMSDEQAAGLDLGADAATLRQRLAQLATEGEQLREENEALRQRLQALERRMQSVAGQVMEYADTPALLPAPATAIATDPIEPAPAASPLPVEKGAAGLPATVIFAAIVLVLLFALYLWRASARLRQEAP
jgi:pilus assembly protein FimV